LYLYKTYGVKGEKMEMFAVAGVRGDCISSMGDLKK
jgi:hypothetical protein